MLDRVKRLARALKRDVHAVWLAARHPRTPLGAKLLALAVAAYALSPIDLIPDVIPVLGYLDDLLIVPLGILLVTRMLPADLLAECRAAAEAAGRRPRSLMGAAAIVALWLAAAGLLGWWLWPSIGLHG
jgi:uncharacterized membrane protein YkvA (DUF1232 family)